jgi:hypothetical protein
MKDAFGGDGNLENYAKTILFAYPLLKTVEKDYEEHIRNKALLSFNGRTTALALAEYLAQELIHQQNLCWLKGIVKGILDKLTEEERVLLSIRYFGGGEKLRNFALSKWNERTYFRRQASLEKKIAEQLIVAGLTEKVYASDFQSLDIFRKIHAFVEAGKDKKISARERRFWK